MAYSHAKKIRAVALLQPPRSLTIEQAAEEEGVSLSTIERWLLEPAVVEQKQILGAKVVKGNATKILRALAEAEGGKLITAISKKLLTLAEDGDLAAIQYVYNRLDGTPTQMLGGDADNPVAIRNINVRYVDAPARGE
jgi:transposase-like protein